MTFGTAAEEVEVVMPLSGGACTGRSGIVLGLRPGCACGWSCAAAGLLLWLLLLWLLLLSPRADEEEAAAPELEPGEDEEAEASEEEESDVGEPGGVGLTRGDETGVGGGELFFCGMKDENEARRLRLACA